MATTFLWFGCVIIFIVVMIATLRDRNKEVIHSSNDLLSARVLARNSNKNPVVGADHVGIENWKSQETVIKTRISQPTSNEVIQFDEQSTIMSDTNYEETISESNKLNIVAPQTNIMKSELQIETEMATDFSTEVSSDLTDVDLEEKLSELTEFAALRRGRGGFDPAFDKQKSDSKYKKRQRNSLILLIITVVSFLIALMVNTKVFIITGILGFGFVLYLVYLRRMVQIELNIRNQRLSSLAKQHNRLHHKNSNYEHAKSMINTNYDSLFLNSSEYISVPIDELNPDFEMLSVLENQTHQTNSEIDYKTA